MAERVILHVGAMKSGTSYLQALLFAQRPRLGAQGVLLPGRVWADQVRAVREAVTTGPRAPRPRWEGMADAVVAYPGTAVISMEYLGPSPARVARRVARRLGPDVDVVLTARDLNRSLVSMWQETVQNGRSWTWRDYVDDVRRTAPGGERGTTDRTTPGGTFWRQQHLVRLAEDWADAVGAERLTLVTVPPPGPSRNLLGERFAAATGLDLDLEAPVASSNESLGLASILVLRRLNELLDAEGLRFPAGSGIRKRVLAKGILAGRRADEPSLGLDVDDWVREQTATTVARLQGMQSLGLRLVGDWADLDPVPVAGISPDDVPESAVTEAAVAGLAGLVMERIRQSAPRERDDQDRR